MVYAWDAGKKALVFTWFDAKGTHARQEYTVFKKDVISGLTYESGPDDSKTGNVMIERLGPDKFKVTVKLASADGKVTEESVEASRKK